MKHLKSEYKKLLHRLAQTIIKDVDQDIADPRVRIIKSYKIFRSNSFGWYIDLLKFSHIQGRGRVSLWLDMYPNIDRPCVSVAFWSTDMKRLKKLTQVSGKDFTVNDNDKVKVYVNGETRAAPLSNQFFEKFIIEKCEVYYFTKYFSNGISISKLSSQLISKVKETVLYLASTIPNVLEAQSNLKAYPTCKNRKLVRLHYARERSTRLALEAKIRDSYHCQICCNNFFQIYGNIARGYAEAHHIIPLSKLSEDTETKVSDLITVCANCHRVLHLMKGQKDDYKKLKRIFFNRAANA